MILPSKELLSSVLSFKIDILWLDGVNIAWREDGMSYINIYELAHKCKEWTTYNGYFLYPARNFESFAIKFGCSIMKPHYKYGNFSMLLSIDGYDEREHLADTEIEAIFLACEWLLKEIKI